MAHVIERVQARYEAREVPFGKVYEWHPAYVAIECECDEQLVLTAVSTTTACPCGAQLGGFARGIQEREGRLPDKLIRPWFHDGAARADQRARDQAAYPKDSSWRFDDVTADDG